MRRRDYIFCFCRLWHCALRRCESNTLYSEGLTKLQLHSFLEGGARTFFRKARYLTKISAIMWQNCTQATFRTSNRKSVRGNKPTCTADPLAVAAFCKLCKVESKFVPKHGMKTHTGILEVQLHTFVISEFRGSNHHAPNTLFPGKVSGTLWIWWAPEAVCTVLPLFHCKSGGRKFELTELTNTSTGARWSS